MRVIYCFCGQCIEGATDADLFERTRDHQKQSHRTHQTSDAQIWAVINANAYEKREVRYHEQTSTENQTSGD